MRTIGVLGGMGPEATIALMARVVGAVAANNGARDGTRDGALDDADHIPLLVDQNTQAPSRIAALIEGTGPSPAPVLADMAARLEVAGAEALVMACNTAHHYADAIEARVKVPFLNMVDLAAEAAVAISDAGRPVGVLASPAVAQVGLYERALSRRGAESMAPKVDLLGVIQDVKANGPTAQSAEALSAEAAQLAAQGARVQIVACTEFSLLIEQVEASGVTFVDALDVLVEHMVRFARGPSG